MIECTYGLRKRLDFLCQVISTRKPSRVLDVGCGTGSNLTELLAEKFTDSFFIGIDNDSKSIAFANANRKSSNVQYLVRSNAFNLGYFDLIIASEVIEHVEDPVTFLHSLRGRLSSTGCVVLTLPNGSGPYELASLLETLMYLTGIYTLLRVFKRIFVRQAAIPVAVDTLAISPHINFFTYKMIHSLVVATGFKVKQFRTRTFLCGFGFDHLIKSQRLVDWNAQVSDRIPAQCASAWMFVLEPTELNTSIAYTRGPIARLRRYLNEKRWKLR